MTRIKESGPPGGRETPTARDERIAKVAGTGLFEQLLRRDSDAIDDLARPVEDLEHLIAERAAELAGTAAARGEFDPAESGIALRTDDVALFHGATMPGSDDRSKTERSHHGS